MTYRPTRRASLVRTGTGLLTLIALATLAPAQTRLRLDALGVPTAVLDETSGARRLASIAPGRVPAISGGTAQTLQPGTLSLGGRSRIDAVPAGDPFPASQRPFRPAFVGASGQTFGGRVGVSAHTSFDRSGTPSPTHYRLTIDPPAPRWVTLRLNGRLQVSGDASASLTVRVAGAVIQFTPVVGGPFRPTTERLAIPMFLRPGTVLDVELQGVARNDGSASSGGTYAAELFAWVDRPQDETSPWGPLTQPLTSALRIVTGGRLPSPDHRAREQEGRAP
ncbi:MAG: hypothetical protein AAF628_18340 [Planctomycetota bacterium]